MWTKHSRPHEEAPRSLLTRLVSFTPFSRVRSTDAEVHQLAILRWAVGFACIARTAPIVWASADYFTPGMNGGLPGETVLGLQTLMLASAATIGVAAPVTLLALLVYYPVFDAAMQTATLGTNFLCLMLGLLAVAGAGAHLSVDSWLLRRGGRLAAPIRPLYRLVGVPDPRQLAEIYFLYFTAFAAINLGAVLHHWDDDAWRSGNLLRIIATSSYLSRFWVEARAFEAYSWRAADAISSIGALGQAAYQALMLPLVFTTWGSRFVIAWGAIFFLVSLFVLQLSYLPLLEIFFWVALFRRPTPRQHVVLPAGLGPRTRRAHVAIVSIGFAAIAAFIVQDFPYTSDRFKHERLDRALYTLGLDVPQVFNRDDLRMGDVWAVIYRDDRQTLLPYHGVNGERLAWVQWNDLFYFGNSLKWRREYAGPASLGRDHDGFWRLVHVAQFDHRRRGVDASNYIVDYYATEASNVRRDAERRFARTHLGFTRIHCVGRGVAVRCE